MEEAAIPHISLSIEKCYNRKIRGKLRGYKKFSTDGFHAGGSINAAYVDGISISIGNPRKHVWTYAVGISDNLDSTSASPYAAMPGKAPPSFVGEHYYKRVLVTLEDMKMCIALMNHYGMVPAAFMLKTIAILTLDCHGSSGSFLLLNMTALKLRCVLMDIINNGEAVLVDQLLLYIQ